MNSEFSVALRLLKTSFTKLIIKGVDEVHTCNLVSLIQHDNVDVGAEVYRARHE